MGIWNFRFVCKSDLVKFLLKYLDFFRMKCVYCILDFIIGFYKNVFYGLYIMYNCYN